ncbi:MAG TPA: AMP-binding protein, partial [Tianweitania sediminis]|nr:AMP-binding protein [Tianweitania sediminis]
MFGSRAAMRHKDRGIWQSWTWSQQRDQIRDFAIGLTRLGLQKGDRVAIVGANRPRLYWAVCAVQSVGGVPVPVYADAVAEELSYVLTHAGVRFAVVQDQEQVDKLQSFIEQLTVLTAIIYDEPRGLR